MTLPLDTVAGIRLLPGETLPRGLDADEGLATAFLWSVPGAASCWAGRGCRRNEVRWTRDLRLGEPWGVLHGPLLLVGDARTAFAVEAATGDKRVWKHRVTGVGTIPRIAARLYRVVEEPRPAMP